MIKMFVLKLVQRSGRPSPIGENGPSDKWIKRFLGRHRDLHMRKPQTIDGGRVRMANKTVMSQYFSLLKDTVDKLGLADKPNLVYNMDETGFGKGVVAQDKVCVTNRGAYTRQVSTTNHTTAAVCVSADGKVLPSFIIFEKSFPGGTYRDGIPEEWLFGTSPNGYMDAALFKKWFERIFLQHASKERPLLLILDNHESHLSLDTIEMARENRVELIGLPPHTTHLLQPLDVALFRPLKKTVSDLAVNLGYANPNLIIGKGRFAQILRAAIDRTFSPHHVKTAFRKCGIVPLNPNAIDTSRLTPVDRSYTFPKPGPGGDNLDLHPLCDGCGQFVHGHPLVTEGLIPKELADIFVPIIGPANKTKNTRIVTESRVLTGNEIYQQLKEKEMTKGPNKKNKPTKNNPVNTASISKDDELPRMNPPKKRKRTAPRTGTKKNKGNDQLAEEVFTCKICNIRGRCNDEEEGILWVGCDGPECGRWFHRDCLNHEEQTHVDLSLLVSSDWLCSYCFDPSMNVDVEPFPALSQDTSHSTSVQSDIEPFPTHLDQDSTTPDGHAMLICQVCMDHQYVSPIEEEIYWATCYFCKKSYHAFCLPPRVYRTFEMRKASDSSWCCQMCPAS